MVLAFYHHDVNSFILMRARAREGENRVQCIALVRSNEDFMILWSLKHDKPRIFVHFLDACAISPWRCRSDSGEKDVFMAYVNLCRCMSDGLVRVVGCTQSPSYAECHC